jgi:hypothetical protein
MAIIVPEEGRAASHRRRLGRVEGEGRQPHRRRALAAVADQGDQRQVTPAGAQHVGRPDVARAHLADVAGAGEARGDQAERDRAQQVAANSADRVGEGGRKAGHRLSLGCSRDGRKRGQIMRR